MHLARVRERVPSFGLPTPSAAERLLAERLLGESAPMRALRASILAVARRDLPVLVHGPTGSGKELVAEALHRFSGRTGAFVPFNVCAVPESMFEDALFGHVRGAFTGACGTTRGYLAEADGGTAFFDEIGGLAPAMQAKLLRVLQTRRFSPVGTASERQSDFRIVAATNEDIDELVEAGRFRADLAYRLQVIVLDVPALRERPEDIPLLARHFAGDADLGDGALARLRAHPWPGNVRELQNVIARATVFCGGRVLRASDIEDALRRAPGRPPAALAPAACGAPDDFERRRLTEVLARHGWDTAAVAAELGVTRKTVYRRIHRLGLAIPDKYHRRRTARERLSDSPDSPGLS
ncbi:MAG TPA: sigma-54 dependent transcriptional regulator [Gemmatimonadaceae bacterium]|nr:sigma-54 dependent transcriptional regulator [Gemmatimonadaceae bacterium]